MNVTENKITKNIWIVFMFIALFWPLAFINKGIDLTDTGYYLANYKHIMRSPESFGIGTFLSNYFGGLIYSVIPSHHLMVFKIFNMVLNDVAIVLSFLVMRRHFNKNALAFLIMIGSFALSEYPQCVSYNTFSILFLSLSILTLIKWTDTKRGYLLVLCGFIIGFSVFFRVPNLLFGILYFSVLWYDIISDNTKEIFKDTIKMLAGGLFGLLSGLGFTLLSIGKNSFMKSSDGLVKMGSNSQGSHSLIGNLKGLCFQVIRGVYEHIYFIAFAVLLLALVSFLIYRYSKTSKRNYMAFTVLPIALMSILSAALNFLKFDQLLNQTEMVAVIMFPVSVFSVFYYREKDKNFSVLSSITLFAAAIMPLGTNNGFKHYAIFFFWFLPYTVLASCKLIKEYYNVKKITLFRAAVLSCSLALVINVSANNVFRCTKTMATAQYREPYHNLNYSPDNSVLAGVYTTEPKCFMLNGVTQFLQKSEYKDKKILVMNIAPIVYVIVNNENVLGATFWPDLESYRMETFESKLQQSVIDDDLPVVIINRIHHDDMTGADMIIDEDSEKVAYVRKFCDDNNYITADEGILNGEKIYTILVPQPE